MRITYAIAFVADMQRSVAFYRDVVGLPLRFESSHWSELSAGEATLALHVSETADGDRDDPEAMPAGRCRPGFGVEDLDRFHARMVEMHVNCVEEPRELFGSRIALYTDPDGLAFSVGEIGGGGSGRG